MDDSVIYEKRFPKLIDEFDTPKDGGKGLPKAPSYANPMAYVNDLIGKSVSIVMPERIGKTELFIQMAKEIGHSYYMDTVIQKEFNQIVVTYTLIDGGDFSCLKELIDMSDEIYCTISNSLIQLHIIFYTHSTYLNGRKIFPEIK